MKGFFQAMKAQHKARKDLKRRFHARIVDKLGFLIAVHKGEMESEWGLPLLRHNSKDWYDIDSILKKESAKDDENKKSSTREPTT
jgi:hypothetical protein